eukprot:COSAG01_NODE_9409_length_2453_cov_30.608542_2_plen_131_part_00
MSILALWVAGNVGSPLAKGVEPEHETEPEPEPRPAAAHDLSGQGGEEIVGTLVPEHPVDLARATQAVRLAKLARQHGEGGGRCQWRVGGWARRQRLASWASKQGLSDGHRVGCSRFAYPTSDGRGYGIKW